MRCSLSFLLVLLKQHSLFILFYFFLRCCEVKCGSDVLWFLERRREQKRRKKVSWRESLLATKIKEDTEWGGKKARATRIKIIFITSSSHSLSGSNSLYLLPLRMTANDTTWRHKEEEKLKVSPWLGKFFCEDFPHSQKEWEFQTSHIIPT